MRKSWRRSVLDRRIMMIEMIKDVNFVQERVMHPAADLDPLNF